MAHLFMIKFKLRKPRATDEALACPQQSAKAQFTSILWKRNSLGPCTAEAVRILGESINFHRLGRGP